MLYRHAQALAAIKAYAPWLEQLYSESVRTNQERDKFYNMIVTLIESLSPLINKQVALFKHAYFYTSMFTRSLYDSCQST